MKPTSQLVNLLIAKSILETILVGTIAVVVYVKSFPPTIHGWGEAVAGSQSISGWVVDYAEPSRRVEVQLFVDGKLVGTQVAQLSRPDIVAAGWARDEWHGYNFVVNGLAAGRHEAKVYALHQSGDRYTLQMLGDPVAFEVREDGSWILARRRSGATEDDSGSLNSCVFRCAAAPPRES